MQKNQNFSALILAAGLSERMGQPKFMLKWKDETFIEKLICQFEKLSIQQIIVVINNRDEAFFNDIIQNRNIIKCINNFPEKDRFHSICLGLKEVNLGNHCFVANVDNPFAELELLLKMSLLIKDNSWVAPVYNHKKGHPILLGRSILNYILEEKRQDMQLRYMLQSFEMNDCETNSDKIFVNINTPDDFNDIKLKYK